VVYFGGFFPKLEFSWGFHYVYLIYIAGRISAAAMAGYIIFSSLAGSVGDYKGAHTVIFREVFSLYYSPEGRANLRWAGRGGGGTLYFLGCRIAHKGATDGVRDGEYYLSKPLWSSRKILYTPLTARVRA
jgi:hypothetical protein